MNWSDVLHDVAPVEHAASTAEITGVQYDSRRIAKGDVFVAMRGGSADGNRFIDAAIKQGAAAIVTDSREAYESLRRNHPEAGAALVEHGRRALAEVSSAVFSHPQSHLALSG